MRGGHSDCVQLDNALVSKSPIDDSAATLSVADITRATSGYKNS